MSKINHSTLQTQVVPALLSGATRQPLDPLVNAEFTPLQLLSLAGQALHFERPAPPAAFSKEADVRDLRRILPAHLRRALVRLLTDRKASESSARALAQAFETRGLRPHPFDFPAIEPFLRSFAERLGPSAEHWVDRQKATADAGSYFAEEALDDTNWTHARPARQVAYLEARRRVGASEARSLLEAMWPQQSADVRFRLLEAFATGLNAEDQPFLTSLEKDRAPRVRSLAARLLARLGASSNNPALAACLERIEKKKSGLLKKRTVLKLDVPAQLKGDAIPPWVKETFGDVSFAELTRALELSEHELIEAAAGQDHLLLGFALMATAECRLDLLGQVVEHLPNAWVNLCQARLDSLGRMSPEERSRWAETLAKPYARNLPGDSFYWEWLHRLIDGPAPASLLQSVVQTKFLASIQHFDALGATWLEVLAAMCPGSQRAALRQQIAAYDAALNSHALTLLELLDEMEKDA